MGPPSTRAQTSKGAPEPDLMAVGFTAGWTSPAIESIKREWNATVGATWGSTVNNLTDGAIEYAELGSLFTLNEDQVIYDCYSLS